jgi:hypothetical protein
VSGDLPCEPVGRVDARLVQNFGVFRRPRRAGDDLPEPARSRVPAAGARYGLNVDLARLACRRPCGHEVYLVPGADVVGLFNQNGSGGISMIHDARQGHTVAVNIVSPYLAPGHIRVLGLLPDDAEQPAVVRRDGTREALIVTGNVYAIELHVRPNTQQPARIEWTRHGHSDGVDVRIPADVASGWPDGVPAGRPDWWD